MSKELKPFFTPEKLGLEKGKSNRVECCGSGDLQCYDCPERIQPLIPEDHLSPEAKYIKLEADAMTMALRLYGESDDTFAPETIEVMSRWRPKVEKLLKGDTGTAPSCGKAE